jgi:RNA polymerase sigma factor (TIGR02999 family)
VLLSADNQELLDLVYKHLRVIAEARMRGERPDHTLQPTALVNEAYMRLLGSSGVNWESRTHFYCAAAEAMRRILIEHARSRGRQKRSGDRKRIPLDLVDLAEETSSDDILALDEAIHRIAEEEPDVAQVIRLRFYAGLSVDETAQALETSPRTVDRLWTYARLRLFRALNS